MTEVIIEIDGDGEIRVEVKGVKGPACTKVGTEFLNEISGPTKEERHVEYYQVPVTTTRIRSTT
jgi:hypothetical protein